MKIKDVMVHNVVCISPDTNIADAACLMRNCNIGDVCVCNENGNLIGIITDRDITINVTAAGLDPTAMLIRDFMTTSIATATLDMSLEDCARYMASTGVRRLPVLDENGKLAGIISLDDLPFFLQDANLFAGTVENVVKFERSRSAYQQAA